jgi:hypothetical protein
MTPLPDMGEKQLLALALRMGALTISLIILTLAAASIHCDYQLAKTIAAGADPIAAACALRPRDTTCSLAAASRR